MDQIELNFKCAKVNWLKVNVFPFNGNRTVFDI